MNDMCEEYEFNMNDCKTLPKWADKELKKITLFIAVWLLVVFCVIRFDKK